MNPNEEKARAAVAEQAGEWFVANEDGHLDEQDSAALAAWLRASPIHVEEFLGVSTIVRNLKEARSDPEYSLEAILARARVEDDSQVRPLGAHVTASNRGESSSRWLPWGATMAACAVASLALFLVWNLRPATPPRVSGDVTALHFATRHGEQLTYRLADNSLLHLNTDSAVSIRYSKTERLVRLTSGEAVFEVAHESERAFRVIAGSAEVIDLGTKFDMHLEQDSTVVIVIEGRVAVGPSPMLELGATPNESRTPRFVRLSADQQIRIVGKGGPATPITIDAQNATAWLRREMVFDHETLERVAAEYNRYTTKQFEIATPALRSLQISGVFATDDTDAFIAFLRSLKGVRVDVTETRIRVFQD
jgi:transmembrane sensor